MKELLLRARVVVRTKNVEISRCCLPDYVKEIFNVLQSAYCTTRLFFVSQPMVSLFRGVGVDLS